ncbi:MAG: histidine phosphatase family protein [Acidobacteriota bacterium]
MANQDVSRGNSTALFVVRHAETEWNRGKRFQGHLDSSLTPRGIQQAKTLAAELTSKHIELIYSSDLGRALHTAQIIAPILSLEIRTEARLRERHLGVMQGLTRQEFRKKYPEEAEQFDSGDPDYVLPGGESARQRYTRCIACAEELASRSLGQHVLLVVHGGVLRSFFHRALNVSLTNRRDFPIPNASLNSFIVTDNQWQLDTRDDP